MLVSIHLPSLMAEMESDVYKRQNLVFEPEWDKDMMSEEAKLELGFL